MQKSNDQHAVGADLVEYPVRETSYDASSRSVREKWPGFRKCANPIERVLHLLSKLIAETWSFGVVEIDRIDEFAFCAGENSNFHRLLIRANTASAESADRCPSS